MNRLVQPATNKADFELLSLAVSAINGCEMCVRAHEEAVLEGGLTEDHVHDAVRIAATIYAAAVALEAGGDRSGDPAVIGGRSGRERGPPSPGRAQRIGRDGSDSCTRRSARSASSRARRAWVSASSGK